MSFPGGNNFDPFYSWGYIWHRYNKDTLPVFGSLIISLIKPASPTDPFTILEPRNQSTYDFFKCGNVDRMILMHQNCERVWKGLSLAYRDRKEKDLWRKSNFVSSSGTTFSGSGTSGLLLFLFFFSLQWAAAKVENDDRVLLTAALPSLLPESGLLTL